MPAAFRVLKTLDGVESLHGTYASRDEAIRAIEDLQERGQPAHLDLPPRRHKLIRIEDVDPVWVPARPGQESSRYLVTEEKDGCRAFSLQVTSWEPGYDEVRRGDGVHEYAMFCLAGDSRRIYRDGAEIHQTPGTIVYQPFEAEEYRHVVGANGLSVLLACSPPRAVGARQPVRGSGLTSLFLDWPFSVPGALRSQP